MRVRSYILVFIINCIASFYCLAENKVFENFARHQSQLMNQASNNKDVVTYGHLLDELKIRYDKLSAKDRKNYAAYLAEGYYNYSCEYSLLNNKSLAIFYLCKAIKAGYNNYKYVIEDSYLNNLRKEPAFIALLQPLREVGDYLYILKKGSTYNPADNRPLPAFTYQPATNPNLVILRKTLNLDSIAGTGNDISKVFNLMYWVHNLIPHDGSRENPAFKNALNMVSVCRREKQGLNCRGLATVLNECYLAMDIPSRVITCLPKDSLKMDNDCHVINMVYMSSLKKWVWLDPTFA
ncbi:MAG: transglutaminase-like domain-containing protein, partial [Mucilaginibacter sp.]